MDSLNLIKSFSFYFARSPFVFPLPAALPPSRERREAKLSGRAAMHIILSSKADHLYSSQVLIVHFSLLQHPCTQQSSKTKCTDIGTYLAIPSIAATSTSKTA
jgi:hypothetical protein